MGPYRGGTPSVGNNECACAEDAWEQAVEEPLEPDPGDEPDPIEELGCYNDQGQWVEGGFLVTFFCCGGELLGTECVADESTTFKTGSRLIFPAIRETIVLYLPHREEHRELVLGIDFDANGSIDGPSEMLLGSWRWPNAVVVLAQFDRPDLGGNDNGWIDPGDFVWEQLGFWDATDLIRPEAIGIVAIDTIPSAERRATRTQWVVAALDRDGNAVLLKTVRLFF